MAEKYIVDLHLLNKLSSAVARRIEADFPDREVLNVYAVPRGGIPAALAIIAACEGPKFRMVGALDVCDLVIDDLIDTGETQKRHPGKPFYALIDKRSWEHGSAWVVWPWEGDAVGGIDDNVRRLIQFVGDDPEREGLLETPKRVAKAWAHWCGGYDADIGAILKTFTDGAEGTDEMVAVVDIPFYSKCEHHMADIFGTATIAYIPNGKIVGLSKLSRLLDAFARRLQVQERLTCQVADALMEHLQPKGAAVVIKARHMCMESRGVQQQGHHTVTSALRGVFKDEPETRSEFLRLAGR
jgi:GTP cyclohydrolase I